MFFQYDSAKHNQTVYPLVSLLSAEPISPAEVRPQ